MFRLISTVAFMLLCITHFPAIITSFSHTRIPDLSTKYIVRHNFIRPKATSLRAVAFDDDNNVVIKDAIYSEAPHKSIPWTNLPKSYYQRKVKTISSLTRTKTFMSMEMFLGRLAMVFALIFFIVEATDGCSVPQQLSALINYMCNS